MGERHDGVTVTPAEVAEEMGAAGGCGREMARVVLPPGRASAWRCAAKERAVGCWVDAWNFSRQRWS